MKIIVTGATGGVGRNLIKALLDRGDEVLAIGRNHCIGKQLNTPFKSCELSSCQEVINTFESADIVFHCAALSSPWGSNAAFQMSNVEATKNVLDAMAKYNIAKIVYVSTSSIYFDFKDRQHIKETFTPKRFVNAYAKTKYQAEQCVLASPHQSVIIRPRGIFGEYDQVLIPRLLHMARQGALPLVKRLGKAAGGAMVDVTYVGNVVQSLLLCADKTLPSGSIFNITNQEPLKISEIYQLVAKTLNQSFTYRCIPYPVLQAAATALETASQIKLNTEPVLTRYGLGLVSYDQTLNNSKACNMLGYRPKFSITQGLEKYAQHCQLLK